MSERKTWADVLDVLPVEKRPKSPTDARATLALTRGEYVYSWSDSPNVVVHRPFADDAHAHIRIAAEDYVREWVGDRWMMLGMDGPNICFTYFTPPGLAPSGMPEIHIFGRGPDLPTALYHAVAYCKEHQQ